MGFPALTAQQLVFCCCCGASICNSSTHQCPDSTLEITTNVITYDVHIKSNTQHSKFTTNTTNTNNTTNTITTTTTTNSSSFFK